MPNTPELQNPEASKKNKIRGGTMATVTFNIENEKRFRNYLRYLSSPLQIMLRNFLAGTFSGLGFMVGTTVILTITGFILKEVLSSIPFMQNLSQALDVWLSGITAGK